MELEVPADGGVGSSNDAQSRGSGMASVIDSSTKGSPRWREVNGETV